MKCKKALKKIDELCKRFEQLDQETQARAKFLKWSLNDARIEIVEQLKRQSTKKTKNKNKKSK